MRKSFRERKNNRKSLLNLLLLYDQKYCKSSLFAIMVTVMHFFTFLFYKSQVNM